MTYRMTETPASFFAATEDRIAKTERAGFEPCVACGRPLKSSTFMVHVIDGGGSVLHPEDEGRFAVEYEQDGSDVGCWTIGPECVKALPVEYRRKV